VPVSKLKVTNDIHFYVKSVFYLCGLRTASQCKDSYAHPPIQRHTGMHWTYYLRLHSQSQVLTTYNDPMSRQDFEQWSATVVTMLSTDGTDDTYDNRYTEVF